MNAPLHLPSALLARMTALALGTLLLTPGTVGGAVLLPSPVDDGSLDAIAPRTAGDKLPDLRMASLKDFHIETLSDGSKRLRVTTTAVNVGEGHFELRASRTSTSQEVMQVQQRIFNQAGWTHYIDTDATMRYAGDGHNHWHVQEFNTLELYRASTPNVAWRLNKIGFCLIDSVPYRSTLPGYSSSRRYYGSTSCGTTSSLSLRPGISLGWGDVYPWNFVRQWIGLPRDFPAGTYRLCATVDPKRQFRELHESNNYVWHDLYINAASNTVSEVAKGWTECRPGTAAATMGLSAGARAATDREAASSASAASLVSAASGLLPAGDLPRSVRLVRHVRSAIG